jgi:hypothetical protein
MPRDASNEHLQQTLAGFQKTEPTAAESPLI